MNDPGIAFRVILISAGILIFLFNLGVTIFLWRRLELSQRLYTLATLCYMLYVGDALREAIQIEYPFRVRLFALAIGEVLFLAFLLEPARSRGTKIALPNPFRRHQEP